MVIVYGGSVVAGTRGYVVYDFAAGASGSNLFGAAYYGSKGLLNGDALWGSFRIGGTSPQEPSTLDCTVVLDPTLGIGTCLSGGHDQK